jgi:hypothetical protein
MRPTCPPRNKSGSPDLDLVLILREREQVADVRGTFYYRSTRSNFYGWIKLKSGTTYFMGAGQSQTQNKNIPVKTPTNMTSHHLRKKASHLGQQGHMTLQLTHFRLARRQSLLHARHGYSFIASILKQLPGSSS